MNRMKRKRLKRVLFLLTTLLVVLVLAGCCLVPYIMAKSAMPADGILTMQEQNDGSFLLSWTKEDLPDSRISTR